MCCVLDKISKGLWHHPTRIPEVHFLNTSSVIKEVSPLSLFRKKQRWLGNWSEQAPVVCSRWQEYYKHWFSPANVFLLSDMHLVSLFVRHGKDITDTILGLRAWKVWLTYIQCSYLETRGNSVPPGLLYHLCMATTLVNLLSPQFWTVQPSQPSQHFRLWPLKLWRYQC